MHWFFQAYMCTFQIILCLQAFSTHILHILYNLVAPTIGWGFTLTDFTCLSSVNIALNQAPNLSQTWTFSSQNSDCYWVFQNWYVKKICKYAIYCKIYTNMPKYARICKFDFWKPKYARLRNMLNMQKICTNMQVRHMQ